uniref:C3H1-type domain-containing protein n=1 Tax=Helicotheca tamesis TaxID=374047 RepID=A0A7S2I229_9STRA|mmetsp:Transcript_4912/g.6758  ORF Transcript_4912/g.6758 Transcript_4912/m.6758 type:complete len:798 (+) Transcript_4912:275-2668(+)
MASTTASNRSRAISFSSKNDAESLVSVTSPAVESAVDAFATRILQAESPPEACVDGSLGPYVASILRCAFSELPSTNNIGTGTQDFDLENDVPEFDSLMELLEEHCCMDSETAMSALQRIAISVRTGIVAWEDDPVTTGASSFQNISCSFNSSISIGGGNVIGGRLGRPFRSVSLGNENDYDNDAINNMLGKMLQESSISNPVQNNNYVETNSSNAGSPLTDESPEPKITLNFVLDEDIPPGFASGQSNVYAPANRATLELNGSGVFNNGTPHSFLPSSPGEMKSSLSPGEPVIGRRNVGVFTPVKEDSLIPGDLLGVLDDPSTPAGILDETSTSAPQLDENVVENATDSLHDIRNGDLPGKKLQEGKVKSKSKEAAQDLAASLFHTSRPRSNSNISEKSPKLKPLSGPPPGLASPGAMNFGAPDLFQQQLNSTTQILLSMNADLGEEAATEAALVSNADVNVAQYVIDGAMSAPPICRHMLNNACYRSDCQFSHDVEGHTCLFWLRGRCGKLDTCRFLHGFSTKLLEGIKSDFLPGHHPSEEKEAVPFLIPPAATQSACIQTTNLLQHNMRVSHPTSKKSQGLFPALSGPNDSNSARGAVTHNQYSSVTTQEKAYPTPAQSGSFAKIASKGYSKNASYPMPGHGSGITNSSVTPVARAGSNNASKNNGRAKFAKIPQELWHACYNRDAGAFQIMNPIERYNEVSLQQPRKDVIDLHFQSTKTFPVVLSQVLPDKLRNHKMVWVVTGSGHHVNKNSHQKTGGILETAVVSWLDAKGYVYLRGRDKNGHGGAVLVKRQ